MRRPPCPACAGSGFYLARKEWRQVKLLGRNVPARVDQPHGGRVVICPMKSAGPRRQQVSATAANVMVVALAKKTACTICAGQAHERKYDREHVSSLPQAAEAGQS